MIVGDSKNSCKLITDSKQVKTCRKSKQPLHAHFGIDSHYQTLSNNKTISKLNHRSTLKDSYKQIPIISSRNLKEPKEILQNNQLLFLRVQILQLHKQLMQIYDSNQNQNINMQHSLKQSKYAPSQQILQFLKSPLLLITKKGEREAFAHELRNLKQSMTKNNERKRMRKMQILKESMLNRQKMIRCSAGDIQYCQIRDFIYRPHLAGKMTIYDRLRYLENQYGYSIVNNEKRDKLERIGKKISSIQQVVFETIDKEAEKRDKAAYWKFGIAARYNSCV